MRISLVFHITGLVCIFVIFLAGFFPLKKISHGFSTHKVKFFDLGFGVDTETIKNGFDKDFLPELHTDGHNFGTSDSIKDLFRAGDTFDSNTAPSQILKKRPLPIFGRMVLMIIDALRADFVFGSLNFFPETHKILQRGHGFQFVATASPPTVTLPRIKAITTGGVPSFVDVALNFGSPALEEDNIILQMKRNGRKVIFFGDDTWTKLFPDHFERSDGTSSFFVFDYTEVDRNVTRHLKEELTNPDWDVMILHYLGLDHIGHLSGPSSPLVKPKLKEMDTIIRKIYQAMEQWAEPSVLVVCGDHGMSDQGGHGGASAGEVSVPALFLSPKIINPDYKHVEAISQTDLCPTLAVLMDLPIPQNNLGKVVTDMIIGFTLRQKVAVIHHNAEQVMKVLEDVIQDPKKESSHQLYTKARDRFQKWISTRTSTSRSQWELEGQVIMSMYSESLILVSETVVKRLTQYDIYPMTISVVLLWMLLLTLLVTYMEKNGASPPVPLSKYIRHLTVAISTAILSHITMCTVGKPSDLMCHATPVSVSTQSMAGFVFVSCLLIMLTEGPKCLSPFTQIQNWLSTSSILEKFLLVGTVAHSCTLLSSSFVEEEHQTFCFFTSSLHLLLLVQFLPAVLGHFRSKHNQAMAIQGVMGRTITRGSQVESKQPGTVEMKGVFTETVEKKAAFPNTVKKNVILDSDKHELTENSRDSSHIDFVELKKQPSEFTPALKKGRSAESGKKEADRSEEVMSLRKCLHLCASIFSVLVILRVLRSWNQTGNKWLDLPDLGDWFVLPQHKMHLSLATVFSLMILGVSQGRHLKRVQSMTVNLALTFTYLYHVAAGSLYFPSSWFLSARGVVEARSAFFLIGLTACLSYLPTGCFRLEEPEPELPRSVLAIQDQKSGYTQDKNTRYTPILFSSVSELLQKNKEICTSLSQASKNTLEQQEPETKKKTDSQCLTKTSSQPVKSTREKKEEEEKVTFSTHERLRGLSAALLCFMCLVLRPHNSVVVVLMSLAEQMMTPVIMESRTKPSYVLLYCVWMGQAFFFFQGNSNNLRTLDLASGYVGLHEFVPAITGTLLCLATFSGTIFWILTYVRIVYLMKDSHHGQTSSTYRLSSVLTKACAVLLLSRALPAAVYTTLVTLQRYHLFVWTVFSPKLLYEGALTIVSCCLAAFLLVCSLFYS